MKLFYLPAIILLAVSCTNEIAENTDTGENILRIGEIDTRSGETNEWVWKEGDKLTVEANISDRRLYTYRRREMDLRKCIFHQRKTWNGGG